MSLSDDGTGHASAEGDPNPEPYFYSTEFLREYMKTLHPELDTDRSKGPAEEPPSDSEPIVASRFSVKMLNVRALNTLLTENADQKLFPRWFIMTPNGSLIAYTLPANIKELRDQAALVSISWKENLEAKLASDDTSSHHSSEPSQRTLRDDALGTLTIEFDNRNLLIRYLQTKLLLVLEGGVPPGRKRPLKVTAEAPGDPPYPSEQRPESPPRSTAGSANGDSKPSNQMLSSSVGSRASTAVSSQSGRLSVLQVHRKKLDLLAKAIKDEFQSSGFVMPEDPDNKFF